MPRIKRSDHSSATSRRRDMPLSPDELLALDNVLPTGSVPKSLAEDCSDRRIFLSEKTGSGGSRFSRIDKTSSMLRLPPKAFLGRPGNSSQFQVVDLAGKDIEPAHPFRPKWSGYRYHPKMASNVMKPSLRRTDGRRLRPHTVYDPDNRQFFVPDGYPQQCIGRLEVLDNPLDTSRKRIGTATLVGSRTIIASAHQMPRDGRPGMWGALFVPAYFNGISMVGMSSWCEAYRVGTTVQADDTQAFDLAVMKLYDPLGDALGWFGARGYDSDWEDEARWTLVGYPGQAMSFNSNAQWPTIENGVRVIDDDPDGSFAEIEHMGDASDGNSGGPLFGTWPNGPYIIGVHSGSEYRTIWTPFGDIVAENNNVAAGGNGMVDMIREARSDWP